MHIFLRSQLWDGTTHVHQCILHLNPIGWFEAFGGKRRELQEGSDVRRLVCAEIRVKRWLTPPLGSLWRSLRFRDSIGEAGQDRRVQAQQQQPPVKSCNFVHSNHLHRLHVSAAN